MIADLDFYFPFVVLFYGLVMTAVTNMPFLGEQASDSLSPELLHWFYGHRILGSICLFVGGLWSLQRVFI